MKLYICGTFILIFGITVIEAGKCSDQNIQALEKCYAKLFLNELDFSYPYLATNFVENLKEDFSTSDGVIKRCKQEAKFQKCLRNYASENLIMDCINVESYLGISYTRNVTKWARQYVTSFFEIDYVCGKGYKTMMYNNDCINSIPALCKSENASGCQDDYVKCVKDKTVQKCGAAAGCFGYKDAKISVCYDETECGYCENLDFENDFYNELCNDDALFNPSTTTPLPTTTTTPDNSTINIVVVTRP